MEKGRRGRPARLDPAQAKRVRRLGAKLRKAETEAKALRDELAGIAERYSQAGVANELGIDRQVVQGWIRRKAK